MAKMNITRVFNLEDLSVEQVMLLDELLTGHFRDRKYEGASFAARELHEQVKRMVNLDSMDRENN